MLERISKICLWTVLAIVTLIVSVCSISPRVMGFVPLTVLSGSMTGTFSAGDLIVVDPITDPERQKSMSVGNVISYHPQPNSHEWLTTHRIIDVQISAGEETQSAGRSC